MIPVVFEGCAGMLHPAPGKRGVVLCAPHGYEELCTHRAWRDLAMRIAAAGMPALRFDYAGTGDSAGDEERPGQVAAWIASVRAAVRFLRAETGVEEVAMVGLRLGAAMAALAAEEIGDVEALALLAPAVTGRGYTREIKALGAISQAPAALAPAIPGRGREVEAGGFTLTAETVDHLARIDLRKLARAPARRVLALAPSEIPSDPKLPAALRALGAAVEEDGFPGFAEFMRDIQWSLPPDAAFERLVGWLGAGLPSVPAAHAAQASAGVPASASVPARLDLPDAVEEHAFVRADLKMFAVHCVPRRPVPGPTVLMVNTGPNRHVGCGRLAVTLARRLAALGHASLRIDIAGVGESATAPGKRDNAMYDRAAIADLKAAIDWLGARGAREIVVVGLCSGAWLGLQAALEEPRIVGQVLANLQRFVWRDSDTVEAIEHAVRAKRELTGALFARFIGALRQPALVGRLLRGEARDWALARAYAGRGLALARSRFDRLRERLPGAAPRESDATGWFRRLAGRGVRTLMVYSAEDAGRLELEEQFGAEGSRLLGIGNVAIVELPAADHVLGTRAARRQFAELVIRHMAAFSPDAASAADAAAPAAARLGRTLAA